MKWNWASLVVLHPFLLIVNFYHSSTAASLDLPVDMERKRLIEPLLRLVRLIQSRLDFLVLGLNELSIVAPASCHRCLLKFCIESVFESNRRLPLWVPLSLQVVEGVVHRHLRRCLSVGVLPLILPQHLQLSGV